MKILNDQKKTWWISWNNSIKNQKILKNNCFVSTWKILFLSEATKVLKEISVNFPSQSIVQEKYKYKISAYFQENFGQISITRRIEAENFELDPTFEKTVNEIKKIHLKSIIFIDMNLLAITLKNLTNLLNI